MIKRHGIPGLLLILTVGCARAGGDDSTPQSPSQSTATVATTATSAPIALKEESRDEGWLAVIAAMQTGDLTKVKERSTDDGYRSLMKGTHDENPAVTFKRWGGIWASWEIRWVSSSDAEAHGNLGPEVKEHGIWLAKDGHAWKLDRWAPGD